MNTDLSWNASDRTKLKYFRENMCTQFSHGLTWDRNQTVKLQDD